MTQTPVQYFEGPHGRLAYRLVEGAGLNSATPEPVTPEQVTYVWLGGFKSDMDGTKAEYIDAWARYNNHRFVRFDYSGHGLSDGKFEDGCISDWRDDARAIIDAIAPGPIVPVGSSMGGWITALIARDMPERIAGVIFLAPAPDFTEELGIAALAKTHHAELESQGYFEEPSEYSDEPTIITRKLIEDGRENLIFSAPLHIPAPVYIIQGAKDPDVPPAHALRFLNHLKQSRDPKSAHPEPVMRLREEGDHRLSTDSDLKELSHLLDEITRKI